MFKLINRKHIGIIQIFGTIGGGFRPDVYDDLLSSIQENHNTTAVVLDIDSPGGSVTASDYLYQRIVAIAERKPVVANVRGIGASGAYMLCCAAHRVVASPGALIGSVGVISVRPIIEQMLARFGVEVTVHKGGKFKDIGALWRKPTSDEEERLQTLVDEAYENFVAIVAKSRKIEIGKVRSLATGEIFWASKAKEYGLVDELGGLNRSVDIAVRMSDSPRRVRHLTPKKRFMERLFSPFSESIVASLSTEIERRLWLDNLRY
jgi:protease-4